MAIVRKAPKKSASIRKLTAKADTVYPHDGYTKAKYGGEYFRYVLAIFLMTTQSFYFPGLGSALTYLGLILFCLSPGLAPGGFERSSIGYLGAQSFVLLVAGILMAIRGIDAADFKSWLSFFVMLAFLPAVEKNLTKQKAEVLIAAKAVILVHCAFVFSQVVYWIHSREYLDFLLLLGFGESGSISKKGLEVLGTRVPRFSGLFNEPGSFSVVIMSTAIALYSYERNFSIIIGTAIAATLCTMSLYGVVLVALLGGMHLITFKRAGFWSILLGATVIVVYVALGGYDTLTDRLASDYSGLGLRQQMLETLFSNTSHIFFGIKNSDYPPFFVLNDIGVWFALWVTFGAAGALMIFLTIFMVYQKSRSLLSVSLVLILFLTKLKFTYPIFWFLVVCIVVFSKRFVGKGLLDEKA